jgi:hypothetical protein
MFRKDGAVARKERIEKIATTVQALLYQNKEAGYVPLRKTVAKLELETGLRRDTVMEYLSLLHEAEQIEIDEEKDQIRRPVV